jgi:multiple sugar transport system ATP-binding protein
MGDRVVVLHQGVVRQIGTPREVYEESADTFVATFLGSPPMNLLDFADVIVGFRPEMFLPVEIVTAARRVEFRFVVKYIEYLGAERLLYGSIEGFEAKEIISRLSRTMPTGYEEGSVHTFAVAEGDLRFFDRKTERRTHPRPYPWQ